MADAVGEILKASACVSMVIGDDLCSEATAMELAEAAAVAEVGCPTAVAAIESSVPLDGSAAAAAEVDSPTAAEAADSWKRAVQLSISTFQARSDALRFLPAADPFAGLSCAPLVGFQISSFVVVPRRGSCREQGA